MSRGSKRWVLRLGVVLVASGIMLLWALRQRSEGVLTIVNQSGRTIVELTVAAGHQAAPYPWQTHLVGHAAMADATAPLGAPMAPVLQLLVAGEAASSYSFAPTPYHNIPPGRKVTVPSVTDPKERIVIRAKLPGGTWANYLGRAGEHLLFNVLPDGTIQPQTGERH